MKSTYFNLAFYVYFIPLFILKLFDITADSIVLKLAGVISVALLMGCMFQVTYNKHYVRDFFFLLSFSALIYLFSGKAAYLFTAFMVISLYRVKIDIPFYRILFLIGMVSLVLLVLKSKDVAVTQRFMNGEWVDFLKRSNLIYVSYTAVLSLYLLSLTRPITRSHFLILVGLSYVMYQFVGSRTGFVSLSVLFLFIVLFQQTRLFAYPFCGKFLAFTPLWCFGVSCLFTLLYDRNEWVLVLDMLLQGRLEQSSYFLNQYGVSLWGQRIVESIDSTNYMILDSAYMDMLISGGLLVSAFWVFLFYKVFLFYFQQKKVIACALLLMYAVYGLTETFLPNCFLNISWLLYADYYYRTTSIKYFHPLVGRHTPS